MNATHRMIALVQTLLMSANGLRKAKQPNARRFYRRLERIEAYLIARFNRDEASDESPGEKEVFQLIWPPVDVGGEG